MINEKMNLIDLCDYQKNSIVSKTVINKKSGTVTFFAIDEGQSLSEHTAPFDALVIIIDGEAEIIIEGNINILKKGEMIIMPENKPHALYAKKRFKMILTLIGK